MASWVGSATQGQVVPAVAVWTVNVPAGLAGQTQVLGVSYKAKTSAAGTVSGWNLVRNVGHSSGPGALAVYVRKLGADAAASTVTVPFGGATQGAYICRTVSGDYVRATPTTDLEGGASVSLSAITVTKAATALLEIWASGEWPRVFTTTDASVTAVHQAGFSGPGLTFGTRVVNAGSVAGATYIADDPGLGGVDTTYTGTDDWTTLLGFALLFETSEVAPEGPPPGYTGATDQLFVAASSVPVTYLDAAAGVTQYLAVNYQPSNTYQVNTPAGWSVVDASRVDENAARLVVFERRLAAPVAAGSVTLTFTGPCTGSVGVVGIAGVTQRAARNDATQGQFSRSVAIPSVTSSVANALTLVFAGSGNFKRTVTAPGTTEIFDRAGPPGLAVAFAAQGLGGSSLESWTPADADNPAADGGDAYRVIAVAISPSAIAPPSGGVEVAAEGTIAYVAAPTNLAASGVTFTSATIGWRDNAPDDTEYQYMYRRVTDPWPTTPTILPANSTSATLALSSGQDYRFIVLARRGQDFSAWSQEFSFATPSRVTSVAVTSPVTRINVGGDVTFTATIAPAEAGLVAEWTITGGGITARQIATDSMGRATVTVTSSATGTIRAFATVSGKVSNTVGVSVGHPVEALVLSVSPSRIEEDDTVRATVTGANGGAYWLGKTVIVTSSNASVMITPASGVMQATSTGGSEWQVALPGIANGTTMLTAYIEGAASNQVAVVVADPPAPPVYTAGVATHCAIHIEAPMAAAVRPRIRRMTHEDQLFHYPGDDGFKFAAAFAAKQPVFFTKDRLRGS